MQNETFGAKYKEDFGQKPPLVHNYGELIRNLSIRLQIIERYSEFVRIKTVPCLQKYLFSQLWPGELKKKILLSLT